MRRGPSLRQCIVLRRHDFRSEAQVVGEDADQTADHGDVADPFQWLLPKADRPGNVRVLGQTAIEFGVAGIVEDVNHVSPVYARWIINAGGFETRNFAELFCSRFGKHFHLRLGAKMQAARRTGLNAGGLKALRNPVHTQSALENLARRGAEFRDVKGATGDAIATADAMILLEIDDAIDV